MSKYKRRETTPARGKSQRWYTIPELDNREVLSVTTVTGQIDKSFVLMPWAVKMAVNYIWDKYAENESGSLADFLTDDLYKNSKKHSREVAAEAADIGTRVHAAVEAYFRGKTHGIEDDMAKPYTAFLKWRMRNKIKVTAIEQTVWSDIDGGYAGTLDLELERTGGLCITDLKAANGIYDEHVVQLSAYWYARQKRSGIEIPQASILRLDKKTGEPEERIYTAKEMSHNFEMFLGLLRYCWARERYNAFKKGRKK